MSHGPTFYQSTGSCIYCGAENTRLTDEHIVPFSLGGNHVLRRASCDGCSRITSKFELKVARGLWGQMRQSFGGRSRRKKKQKKTQFITNARKNDHIQEVPNEWVPAILPFYEMPVAGILQNLDENYDSQSQWKLSILNDSDRQKMFEEKYGFKPIVGFRHQPQEFAQLILKIGYGQVLTQFNRREFEPICLPYILGQKTNVSWLIGSEVKKPEPCADFEYALKTKAVLTKNSLYLVADIKLWAHTGMPWYHAVVGRVSGMKGALKILQKIHNLNQESEPE